jgi:hypothetical protein
MTGDTPASAGESDDGARSLSDDERLVHYGLFLPDQPTWACGVEFTLDDVKAALFESTYSNPKYLVFKLDDENTMRVAVEAVRAVYSTYERGLGCFERPDWMIYGWLPKSGYDPHPDIVRVRCYLQADRNGRFEGAEVQHVPTGDTSIGSSGGIDAINNPPD